jgi:hypothetical protein
MDNQISRRFRAGFIAASLSAALMLGGLAINASAQQGQDRHDAANPGQASPAQTMPGDDNAQSPAAVPQTAPDQDNGVRPAPNKDREMQANPADRDRDQANPADRDKDKDKDRANSGSEASENSKAGRNEMRREVKEFDTFLDSHPEVAKDLRQDPNKINDESYVSQHPELNKWLKEHTNIQKEIRENPSAFMNRENNYEKSESPKH